MKFEEQFPSLKGKVTDMAVDFDSYNAPIKFKDVCLIKDIQEHCLDKQRVREAIDKVFDLEDYEDEVHNHRIKKELGLEE